MLINITLCCPSNCVGINQSLLFSYWLDSISRMDFKSRGLFMICNGLLIKVVSISRLNLSQGIFLANYKLLQDRLYVSLVPFVLKTFTPIHRKLKVRGIWRIYILLIIISFSNSRPIIIRDTWTLFSMSIVDPPTMIEKLDLTVYQANPWLLWFSFHWISRMTDWGQYWMVALISSSLIFAIVVHQYLFICPVFCQV